MLEALGRNAVTFDEDVLRGRQWTNGEATVDVALATARSIAVPVPITNTTTVLVSVIAFDLAIGMAGQGVKFVESNGGRQSERFDRSVDEKQSTRSRSQTRCENAGRRRGQLQDRNQRRRGIAG